MDHRPDPSEYAPFYSRYVSLVPAGPVRDTLCGQPEVLARLVIPAAGGHGADPDDAYAPGKWTVLHVLRHIVDTERVFAFRALWFARADASPLPGFDENAWVAADPSRPSLDALVAEFRAVRAATVALADGLAPESWSRTGTASGHTMTVRGALYVVAGHAEHHMAILRERYSLGA
ncbi:MAG TPA: DinB family protein [Rubricoccaceae bacterium]|jgi:hypothetical protein